MLLFIFMCIVAYCITGVSCQIQFQPDTTQHCNGQPVEYQCSSNGTGPLLTLRWRILQKNGTQFDLDALYISGSNQEPGPIGEVFTPERLSPLSESPLVSNISFTAQSSINGYTIVCDDTILDNESFAITGIIIIIIIIILHMYM